MKKNQNILDKIEFILDAFKDMGKLSPLELMKGQYLNPDDDNFKQVTGRVFYQSINQIRQNDIDKIDRGLKPKGLKTLSIYKVNDYNNMKCYLGQNNSSGYCIAHNDEIVSVFSSQKSSIAAIMKDSIKNGARRLDCYAIRNGNKISGKLFKIYSKYGFKIDKTMNSGKQGEIYAIINGVSDFVNDKGEVEPDNPEVVIFMKR